MPIALIVAAAYHVDGAFANGPPLTVCISFVVMQDQGIDEALTAGVHFEQAGFRALLLEG